MNEFLESAISRVGDVIGSLRASEPGDDGSVTAIIINDAITTLRAAERELREAYRQPRGQCRAERADDDTKMIYRCFRDAGHDGIHEGFGVTAPGPLWSWS